MPQFRNCNLCGTANPKLLWKRNDYAIVACGQCGLQYVGQNPQDIDFAALYSEAYYTGGSEHVFADYVGEEAERRASARRKLWSMRRRTARAGRLLDLGCAAGFFLAEARRYSNPTGSRSASSRPASHESGSSSMSSRVRCRAPASRPTASTSSRCGMSWSTCPTRRRC